ncbi:hypothetical protein ACI68E_001705 [Malassezia pachydermatis]
MQCGGEATSDDRRPLVGTGDGSNLYNYIDHDRVWGVNIEPPESAKVALKPWDERHSMDRYMESGVDDQMIVTIPFTCPVRIQSILLFAGRSDMAVRVRIYASDRQRCAAFVNRPHGIDFDEALSVLDGRLGPATSGRAQADFALLENAAQVTSYPVSASRFAHTNSVSLLLVCILFTHPAERFVGWYHVAYVLYWVCRQSAGSTRRYHQDTRCACGYVRDALRGWRKPVV